MFSLGWKCSVCVCCTVRHCSQPCDLNGVNRLAVSLLGHRCYVLRKLKYSCTQTKQEKRAQSALPCVCVYMCVCVCVCVGGWVARTSVYIEYIQNVCMQECQYNMQYYTHHVGCKSWGQFVHVQVRELYMVLHHVITSQF